MKILSSQTHHLDGVVRLPGSKSEAIRALMFALLSQGTSHIHNMLEARDIEDAIQACQTMGAIIVREGSHLMLSSQGAPFTPKTSLLYTGNSGVTTRFMAPLLGLRTHPDTPIQLACGEQMKARPMEGLISALGQLGMKINSLDKKHSLPISTTGSLIGGNATLLEPISQYLSALMTALPLATETSTLRVGHIPAWPYVEMTFQWLKRLNIVFTHDWQDNLNTVTIPGNQRYQPFEYTLSGDFSSASYFIAAAAMLPGQIRLKGLNMHDAQGDRQLVDIIIEMGGRITFDGDDMIIEGGHELHGIRIDARQFPDLVPTIAVLGTVAQGKTEIINVGQARLKETDRIHSMTEGLTRLGAHVEEQPDGMIVYPSLLKAATVKGYHDHRTIMALSLAGMIAKGTTVIEDAQSIDKTFPGYVTEMNILGANMEICA